MPRHTPGPWKARADRTVADSRGVPLLRGYADNRNWEGNAPLVEAAPELLQALIACAALLEALGAGGEPGEMPAPELDRAQVLIARIEGVE
jgi:hypothetical protein